MASRFWVGGTGTWDSSTTTHWAATTGGAGGQSVPGSADDVTFDGSSGGGTITVNTTVTVLTLTCGAFTGTLDFSANNNNVTLSGSTGFNGSGTGTRTINLGNGTWTLSTNTASTIVWTLATTTGLTFNANSSIIQLTGNTSGGTQRQFQGGSKTYSTLVIGAQTSGGTTAITGGNTFATLTVTGQNFVTINNTLTVTTLNLNGTSSGEVALQSAGLSQQTLSVASNPPTMTWVAFRGIGATGGASFVASNSFDLGANSGITITAPSASGGGVSRAKSNAGVGLG